MFIIVLVCLSSIVFASSVTENQIDTYLNACIDSKHHKSQPGPETASFRHCSPWKDHACCKANTTHHIANDGTFSLYRMKWDQCRPLSAQCRRFLEMDTCFYECSPNLKPWIQVVPNSKTRRERFVDVPLCSSDCDDWFEACKDDYTCSDNWMDFKTWNWTKTGNECKKPCKTFKDYTCSDNWGNMKTWKWTKTGNECKKPCKTFKDYYGDPVTFCNRLFNYSFKYKKGKPGEDCFMMWPNGTKSNANVKVAREHAREALSTSSSGLCITANAVILLVMFTLGMFTF